MFYYFGYGSNISVDALRKKGVVPMRSEAAMLEGWRLVFNVPNFFGIEGNAENIEVSPKDTVHGVLHTCRDAHLSTLDHLEGVDAFYRRIEASVRTYSGRWTRAYIYVGIPTVTDENGQPSEHYVSSLVRGALEMHLDPAYVDKLRALANLPSAGLNTSTDRHISSLFAAPLKTPSKVATRRVLEEAAESYRRTGNENRGFLSESCGFIPIEQPRQALPPLYAAWDQAVAALPELYRTLRLRRELDSLPRLPADLEHLPDEYLLRAAAVLAILSHAYQYVETHPPERQPEALSIPWTTVSERLSRGPTVLTYIDLIVYNWRLLNPDRPDSMRIENMRLLIPTVDNNEERIFHLTQVEILAYASPIVGAVVRAQEAVLNDDREALESELSTIIECLKRVVRHSLLHINPNPGSAYYVDPVVWAKTVAPLAVPFRADVLGPSGTTSPLFNMLDIFFGRKEYQTVLGKEIYKLRGTYPPLWQDFLIALGDISIPEYVKKRGDPNLTGLLQEAFQGYAGEHGFLGRHRMKVYGYLQLAFKVGRSVTIGGFRGVFQDRTWDRVDSELELSRVERTRSFPESCYHLRVKSVDTFQSGTPDGICHVVLDISGSGIRYEAGDRCGILPENSPELVARTLTALGATGDEMVILNREWRTAVRLRAGRHNAIALTLGELLRFGCIRPVTPRVAEALHALTQNELLKEQMLKQSTEHWELWDLLELLRQFGYDPRQLWKMDQVSVSGLLANAICRVVPPEAFRMYSISSVMSHAATNTAQEVHLTVGRLRYQTASTRTSQARSRQGTASNFLANVADRTEPISLIVQHPPRFGLPQNPRTPIIMLAGGSGVSPFRAFLFERSRQLNSGQDWLFLGLRSREYFCYEQEFAGYLERGTLNLQVAFSRDDVTLRYVQEPGGGRFATEPGQRGYVSDLLLSEETARAVWDLVRGKEEGGQGAYVYVCGRSRFARSVIDAFRSIFRRFAPAAEGTASPLDIADDMLCRLVAEGRFMQEVFTGESTAVETLMSLDVSEVVKHNDAQHGYWMVYDGKVYDLTEFIRLHPGGTRIMLAYAGMDASDGYARAHQGHSEIDAMRDMYLIGTVRTPRLGRASAKIAGPAGPQVISIASVYRVWVQALYLLVEMQNALRNDLALQSAVTTRDEPLEPRSPYRLQRAVETQQRFLRNYLDGLAEETLPNLWTITHGFFGSERPADWMRNSLEALHGGEAARFVNAMVLEIGRVSQKLVEEGVDLQAAAWQRVRAACDIQATAAHEILARLKETLRQGVMVFEEFGLRTGAEGAPLLIEACCSLTSQLSDYFESLRIQLLADGQWEPEILDADTNHLYQTMRTEMKTLYLSNHWVMEEDAERKLVFLKRTPVAFGSIFDVVRANDEVIGQIRQEHTSFGVVVDMRQAPLRNDPIFENAMGKLRTVIAQRFDRSALLLETAVGVLQVNRLGREEGKRTFATRSEVAAIKFAMGQG